MAKFLFSNNAQTTLAAPVNPSQTVITVASGAGANFPNPVANQQFALTLASVANPAATEIVYVTGVTGDTFTVLRAQENTIAQSWSFGDFAANLLTAGVASSFNQSGA